MELTPPRRTADEWKEAVDMHDDLETAAPTTADSIVEDVKQSLLDQTEEQEEADKSDGLQEDEWGDTTHPS